MPRESAGILLYRRAAGGLELFLIHPGGPFFVRQDEGVWSIPKGLLDFGESHLDAARREFAEETGHEISGEFLALTPVFQKNGKKVLAWAVEGDLDADRITSNTFSLEWPPKSGRMQEFPEVDRGGWFSATAARTKINPAQATLIDELIERLQTSG